MYRHAVVLQPVKQPTQCGIFLREELFGIGTRGGYDSLQLVFVVVVVCLKDGVTNALDA